MDASQSGDSGISADIHQFSSDEYKDAHTPSSKSRKNQGSNASADRKSPRFKKNRGSTTSAGSTPRPSDLRKKRGSNTSAASAPLLSNLKKSRGSNTSADSISCNLKKVDVNAEKWCHVVAEIVETEIDHYTGIGQIVEAFLTSSHGQGVFSKDEIQQIFSNIEDICSFSESIASRTMDFVDDPVQLCSIFVEKREQFINLYGQYVANFPQALSVLHDAQQRLQVSKHLKKAEVQHNRRLSLQSELIRPIQRILKYPLLLKELRKSMANMNDNDANRITAAVESMSSVAQRINEIKAEQEQYAEIQSRFVKWKHGSLAKYGPLIYEGPLKEVGSSVKHFFMPRDRHAFLFRHLFVLGKPRDKEKNITIISVIKLSELGCTEIHDSTDAHCFQLVQMTSLANSHVLSGMTKQESKKWYEVIRDTLFQDTDLPDGVRKILDKDEQAVTNFQSLCSEAVECGRRASLIAKTSGFPSVNTYTEDDEESDDEDYEVIGFLPPYYPFSDLSHQISYQQLPEFIRLKSNSVVTIDSLPDNFLAAIGEDDCGFLHTDTRSVQDSTTNTDTTIAATTSLESLDTPIPSMADDDEFERPAPPPQRTVSLPCPPSSTRPFMPPLLPSYVNGDADAYRSCSEEPSTASKIEMDGPISSYSASQHLHSLGNSRQLMRLLSEPTGGVRSSQSSSALDSVCWGPSSPQGQLRRSGSFQKGLRPSSSLGDFKNVNVTIGEAWFDVEQQLELENKNQKEESSKKPKSGKTKKDTSTSTTPSEIESPYASPPASIRISLERVREKISRSLNGSPRTPSRREFKPPLAKSPMAVRDSSTVQGRALPTPPQTSDHYSKIHDLVINHSSL